MFYPTILIPNSLSKKRSLAFPNLLPYIQSHFIGISYGAMKTKESSLSRQATSYTKKVTKEFERLGFKDMMQAEELFEIVGSVKYKVGLQGESDVDVWITSNNVRESFLQKTAYLTKLMTENKLFKAMKYNNFYDSYEKFDEAKKELLGHGNTSPNFMISLDQYADDSLQEKIKREFHIAEQGFQEEFPELLTLSAKDRKTLLELKQYVYKELPFFWNRSYLLYKGFLAGHRDRRSMYKYLEDSGYEDLFK